MGKSSKMPKTSSSNGSTNHIISKTSSSNTNTSNDVIKQPKEAVNGSTRIRTNERDPISRIRRRGKRESESTYEKLQSTTTPTPTPTVTTKKATTTASTTKSKSTISTTSRAYQKHNADKPSGGIEALLPSAIGLAILICGVMAKMGFRGRATVAGIDLGTTNSVICVQAPAKGVGVIECLPDPTTNSPIVPSVVSFLEPHEWKVGPSSKKPSLLNPHPSTVIVGAAAKQRIDSHPQSTLYNAKRILGRPYSDNAISILQKEVEFAIHENDETDEAEGVHFTVPNSQQIISPVQVGGYVVNHLKNIMDLALGHENVRSAVICVPAKFDAKQRQLTVDAFTMAGIKVVRIVEEPTSAALAYGLHRKPNVDYILVYDFGGGTLDVSLLYVTDGFVDVMGSDGDDNLGGTDFDILIAQYLQKERGGQSIIDTTTAVLQNIVAGGGGDKSNGNVDEAIIQKCSKLHQSIPLCTVSSFHTIGEQLKIQLSNKYYEATPNTTESDKNTNVIESITASAQCYGLPTNVENYDTIQSFDDFCTSLIPYTLSITQKEFNIIAKDLFERSINPVKRLIHDLNIQITDIDEIVMVGGTTRMPQIRTLVQQYMYHVQQLNTHIDPDLTVAYGAASVID